MRSLVLGRERGAQQAILGISDRELRIKERSSRYLNIFALKLDKEAISVAVRIDDKHALAMETPFASLRHRTKGDNVLRHVGAVYGTHVDCESQLLHYVLS